MIPDSLGQPNPLSTQSSAQDLGEDDQQSHPQQEDPGSEAIVFEKKWIVTDGGERCERHVFYIVNICLTVI